MGPTPPAAEYLYETAGLIEPDLALPGVVLLSVASVVLTIWVLTRPVSLWRAGRRRMEGVLTRAPNHPGLITITGEVAYASDANVAVRLDVTQQGTEEESSGTWSQSWKETDRKVTVAPFELELEDGSRLRVEPTRNVFLTDAFDKKVLINRTTRIRTAELMPGERVWIDGELVSTLDPSQPDGYRGSGKVLVLKDSPKHRMRISSERLDAPHDKKAHWWLLVGLAFLLGSVILQISFGPFYLRSWYGATSQATVVGRHVEDGGDSSDEYLVDVRLQDGTDAEVTVEGEHHNEFVVGMPMAVRRVRGTSWFTQAGPQATLPWFHLFIAGFVIGTAAVLVGSGAVIPWNKLEERFNETEPGRLPKVDP